jgi:beta-lactamase class A
MSRNPTTIAARDTTTPRAIAGTVQKILLGEILGAKSREQLEQWMIACTPGRKRIRAALPADWIAGDRPGTSVERETNDYAIVRPPFRAPLIVATYYDAARLSTPAREAVLQEAGAIFVRWASE